MLVFFLSEKVRTKQEISTSIQVIAGEHKINPELLLAHEGMTMPSHSVASNCLVPLVFLRSREISLMVKSVWKGAICSRRIKRCFIKKSCPSTWVYSTRKKKILITCKKQPLNEQHNFNTFTFLLVIFLQQNYYQ